MKGRARVELKALAFKGVPGTSSDVMALTDDHFVPVLSKKRTAAQASDASSNYNYLRFRDFAPTLGSGDFIAAAHCSPD